LPEWESLKSKDNLRSVSKRKKYLFLQREGWGRRSSIQKGGTLTIKNETPPHQKSKKKRRVGTVSFLEGGEKINRIAGGGCEHE